MCIYMCKGTFLLENLAPLDQQLYHRLLRKKQQFVGAMEAQEEHAFQEELRKVQQPQRLHEQRLQRLKVHMNRRMEEQLHVTLHGVPASARSDLCVPNVFLVCR